MLADQDKWAIRDADGGDATAGVERGLGNTRDAEDWRQRETKGDETVRCVAVMLAQGYGGERNGANKDSVVA